MESEGKETVGAEGLPATFFAESEGRGAAAVVIDESLVAVLEILCDGGEEGVGEVAIFGERFARGETDDFDLWRYGRGFGLFRESDEGVFGLSQVEVGNERGGGAEEARDFEGASEEGGEAEGGVFRGVFLVVGGFVGFVDDDETEIFERGEEGGAGADDDLWGVGVEEAFPGEVAFSFGLAAVKEGDALAEGGFKDLDELGSQGDFWDEEDDRLVF